MQSNNCLEMILVQIITFTMPSVLLCYDFALSHFSIRSSEYFCLLIVNRGKYQHTMQINVVGCKDSFTKRRLTYRLRSFVSVENTLSGITVMPFLDKSLQKRIIQQQENNKQTCAIPRKGRQTVWDQCYKHYCYKMHK